MLDQSLESAQQHRQSLALLGTPDEDQAQLVGGRLGPARGRGDVDAVRDHLVGAPEPAPSGPGGGLGDRDAPGELVELAAHAGERRHVVEHGLGRVGVERGDHRGARIGARVPAHRAGRRFVHVDDVGIEIPQRPPHPGDAVGEDADVGDRAVGSEGLRSGERDHVVGQLAEPRVGTVKQPVDPVGRVAGGEHPKLVAACHELAGQGVDVPVHTPRICPRVRRDDRYAHQSMVPIAATPGNAFLS